ncbi:MAG: DUF2059 domain-containing protein [Deltaproteobacteria bacterium]|nr:DUF2059 domain-containing protein [Deltaproteobacteria bacterium]
MLYRKCLFVALLFLLPLAVHAQSPEDALMNELYVKSGMEKQVEQFPLIIQAGFDQAVARDEHLQRLPQNITADIRRLIKQSFTEELFKKTMLEEVATEMSRADIKQVLQWLDSPLGKKCRQLEEAATTPEILNEIQAYAIKMQESPPSKARLRLVQEFDAVTQATEANVTISMNTQFAVTAAIVATLPPEAQIPPDEIMGELEKVRADLKAMLRPQVIMSILYTYRTLSDDELERYIEFSKSRVGSKYQKVTISGFKKALTDGAIRWGHSIGKLLQHTNKQSEA